MERVADRSDLGELCARALSRVGEGEQAEAYAGWNRKTEVRARGGDVDALTSSESRGVGVRILVDGRLGYAWAADPSEAEAAELLELARASALHTTPDDANVLPEASPAEPMPGL